MNMVIVHEHGKDILPTLCYEMLEDIWKRSNLGKNNTYFLSGWDSNISTRAIDCLKNSAWISAQPYLNKYINVEDVSLGMPVATYVFQKLGIQIAPSQILLGNGATSLLAMALIVLGIKEGIFLVLAPTYFSVIDSINLLKDRCTIVAPEAGSFRLNVDLISRIITEQKVIAVVITDPFFSFGLPIHHEDFRALCNIVNESKIPLVCDFAREGPQWEVDEEPIIGRNLTLLENARRYIAVYSPCKKISVNGLKLGVLIASEEIAKKLRYYSDSLLGSLSSPQLQFLKLQLCLDNKASVYSQYRFNVKHAKANYELLKTLTAGTNAHVHQPKEGYYAVLEIPRKYFGGTNDLQIYKQILYCAHAITLPMSLYKYYDANSYCFRINLLLQKQQLLYPLTELFSQIGI